MDRPLWVPSAGPRCNAVEQERKRADCIMEHQAETSSPSQVTFTLEIVPDDPRDADPALVDAIGRDATDALRQDGSRVEPVYTGQRGGFLVDVTMFVSTAATYAWANKDIIIADISGIVTILTSAVLPVVKQLRQAYEKRVGKNVAEQYPIKFTLEIAGKPVSFEVADLEGAEGVLKLAQRIHADHPGMTTKTPQSKLTTSVPKGPVRRRR